MPSTDSSTPAIASSHWRRPELSRDGRSILALPMLSSASTCRLVAVRQRAESTQLSFRFCLADIRKTGEIPGVGPDGALVAGSEDIVVLNLEARLPRDELKSCALQGVLDQRGDVQRRVALPLENDDGANLDAGGPRQ